MKLHHFVSEIRVMLEGEEGGGAANFIVGGRCGSTTVTDITYVKGIGVIVQREGKQFNDILITDCGAGQIKGKYVDVQVQQIKGK